MGLQLWMLLLLFRRDSLPLVRSAILVCSFRARFDTHGRLPLSLGLLNPFALDIATHQTCQEEESGSPTHSAGLPLFHFPMATFRLVCTASRYREDFKASLAIASARVNLVANLINVSNAPYVLNNRLLRLVQNLNRQVPSGQLTSPLGLLRIC